ncbi:hypothetical protein MUK42_19307, partial [Musa troglodytarum]
DQEAAPVPAGDSGGADPQVSEEHGAPHPQDPPLHGFLLNSYPSFHSSQIPPLSFVARPITVKFMTIPPNHHLSAAVRWDHGCRRCRHQVQILPAGVRLKLRSIAPLLQSSLFYNDFAAAERRSEEDRKDGGLPARIPQSSIASSHRPLAKLP